ncbi:MAG: MarR family winged helix-turn-helix transcriptional regulator [Rhodobacteraceae bacterium]|nr:MarR family winged helix-turn-helix transcriptional regulator [Paracoccaceae bacterium]
MTGFDLDDFLPYQLAVAAARVSRGFADRYREEFGITIPEWRVLAHLSAAGAPVSVREIHARVDMDKSKVSRAAARLERAGLVAKAENAVDRRLVALTLTPAGAALVARIVPVALDWQAEMTARLGSAGDVAAFRRVLARVIEEA